MNLGELETSLIDGRTKGMPGGMRPITLSQVGAQGWNVLREDLPLPLCVMRESAIQQNSNYMRNFLKATGAEIAPHGKTTMSPQLYQRQLKDGAWAITIGSIEQMQVCRFYGVPRVLLANQPVGVQAQRYLVEELKRDPDFDFYCLVDSVELAEQLAAAARAGGLGRPIQVILEGGFVGGRTGCRTRDEAIKVGQKIKSLEPHLSLRGVGGYEALLRVASAEESEKRINGFLQGLIDIALECNRLDLFGAGDVILTAGGTVFYDLATLRFKEAKLTRPVKVVIRCGCYLTHDSHEYVKRFEQIRARLPWVDDLGPPPTAALEVWAYVQSRPEQVKALLTMGKRDVTYDSALPKPTKWFRPRKGATAADIRSIDPEHVVTHLNDQHCHMTLPADSPLQVGDMVGFGIAHPCLTFDKWQLIAMVDDDYNVTSGIRTFF
jgi:D-serine dehydratase